MTNKEMAKAWFAAIDANDFEKIKNFMDSTHLFHNPMSPGPIGRDEHIGMIRQITTSMNGSHHLDLLVSEGEYVTVRGRFRGKHMGEFNGIPATGKPVEFSWIDIFHIVDGKVTDEYFEFNPMSMMAQIGAVPQNS